MMTFADYALFIIAMDAPEGAGAVTASFNGEFVDAAELAVHVTLADPEVASE